MVNLRVFRNFLQKAILRGRLNPLEFMDEYASVMNRYVKIEVRNRFKEGVLICLSTLGVAMGGCYG